MNSLSIYPSTFFICITFLHGGVVMAQHDKEGRSRELQGGHGVPVESPPTGRTAHPFEKVEAQLKGEPLRLDGREVENAVASWPQEQQALVRMLREKYGEPHEATASMVKWHGNGDFVHTTVFSRGPDHDPSPAHKDLLEQAVYYRVPPGRAADLAAFNGSISFDRTMGTLTARSDSEEHNLLALNLAHEVITEKRSVQEAREFHASSMASATDGEENEYMKGLMFEPDAEAAAE